MPSLNKLALVLGLSLPLALFGCTSDNTSSTAQMVECTAGASGPTGCHAVSADDHAAGTCVDRDEDGDGQAHDVDDGASADGATSTDDDGDGTADTEDNDDDNDGVNDDRDCDELPGQDGDDTADA